ncbi:cyclic nucleotide-binding domain-containing protein [Spongisporangium articulatum]|uniref:Cyclic nucleotide-binding domain-containing protein n=1 Tax=Spongisporangium articulatum TaxID=3362603 RepID=A0ABW8AJ21_9ACTN
MDAPRSVMVFRSLLGNRPLTRVALAYTIFILTEYAVWIAMIVYAYQRGGVGVAGAVVLAQLIPAALFAPLAAGIADRRSPVLLLGGGYVVQALGTGATAAAMAADLPWVAYAAAAVASTAVTTTRPAQAALLPALARTPQQLTAANVALGWLESGAQVLAGVLCGVLIGLTGPAGVFVACAALLALGPLLVGTLRPVVTGGESDAGQLADLLASARLVTGNAAVRLLVSLITAVGVIIGAVDLLYVVVAVDVLGRGEEWAGYLNTAFGVGSMLAGVVTALLVGRRLGRPIVLAALVVTAAVASLGAHTGLVPTVAYFGLIGGGLAVLNVTARTLLQRTVPVHETARVFGLLEGLFMAGLAVGTALVSGLQTAFGTTGTFVGLALLLPLAGLAGGRALFRLDSEARVPVVEIALLRSLPLFAELPLPTVEGLAQTVREERLSAGTILLREGDVGDAYYAIADGELEVSKHGVVLRHCRRGDGVGEIGLLHAVPRTATVTATTPSTVYALAAEPFLAAVTGHVATGRLALEIAQKRLETEP